MLHNSSNRDIAARADGKAALYVALNQNGTLGGNVTGIPADIPFDNEDFIDIDRVRQNFNCAVHRRNQGLAILRKLRIHAHGQSGNRSFAVGHNLAVHIHAVTSRLRHDQRAKRIAL